VFPENHRQAYGKSARIGDERRWCRPVRAGWTTVQGLRHLGAQVWRDARLTERRAEYPAVMARRVDDHKRRPADVSIEFASDAGAPRKARAAIQPLIVGDDDPIAADVELVTSELASNVVQHTGSGGTLQARDPNPDVPLRLEVADQGVGEPEPVPHSRAAALRRHSATS